MNRVVHWEHFCSDVDAAAAFYAEVFGWRAEDWEGPFPYKLVYTGDEGEPGIDGAIAPPGSVGGQAVVNTLDVEDIDATIETVLANGGSSVTEKSTVPGVGYHAYLADPTGVVFGVMQDDSSAGV